MEQIVAQWPLLGGFLLINAALLRIIQQLYERMVKTAEKDAADAEARADRMERLVHKAYGVTEGAVEVARQERPS